MDHTFRTFFPRLSLKCKAKGVNVRSEEIVLFSGNAQDSENSCVSVSSSLLKR
jgi:hypothetical protein